MPVHQKGKEMSMTYHYGRYWAEIRPVKSADASSILYWNYRIFETGSDKFLFDGHDADYSSARITAEKHVDRLNEEDRNLSRVA